MNTASYGLELFFALSIWGEAHTKGIDTRLECHDSGASPGFGRGSQEFFLRFGKRFGKPCALLGGFGGMSPQENFLKWCNLVRFGVYFDQILSLKNFNNYHFLYKNIKIAIFYIRE